MDDADGDSAEREMDAAPIVSELMARLGERYGLKRYKRTPPDREVDPIYVDDVDVAPPGGKGQNPDGPWLWCSECEKPKFWHGIAFTNPEGDLFLIGRTCAGGFYGRDRVASARNRWLAERDRRNAEERLASARAVASDAARDAQRVQADPALHILDGTRARLGAMADMCFRLRSHLQANGGSIVLSEPFRDAQGRTQLRSRLLGRFLGSTLVHNMRREVKAAQRLERAAAAVIAAVNLEKHETKELVTLSREFFEAGRELATAWSAAREAHRFFDPVNLARLIQFARSECGTTLQIDKAGRLTGPGKFALDPIDKLRIDALIVDFERLL